jgi:guanylate kinase
LYRPKLYRRYFKKVRDEIRKGLIFVISGPSGSGKTTLAHEILKQPKLKKKFIKSISFTTRPKRPSERQGRSYFFVCPQEFRRLLKAKKILEHTHYLGYDYGTSRNFLEQAIKKGLHLILCLDVKGAAFLNSRYPERTITIFVKPPSLDAAKKRIVGREAKTKTEELNKRLQLARKELSFVNKYNYCVVNDNLNQAIKQVVKIIQQFLEIPSSKR